MKAVARVDMSGVYVGDIIVEDSFEGIVKAFEYSGSKDEAGNQIGFDIGYPVPPGFYKPRFDMDANLWVESLSENEIKGLTKPSVGVNLKDIIDAQAVEIAQLWDFVLNGGAR